MNEKFEFPSWMNDTSRRSPEPLNLRPNSQDSTKKNKSSKKDPIDIPSWVNDNSNKSKHEEFVSQYRIHPPKQSNLYHRPRPKSHDIHNYKHKSSSKKRNIKGWIAASIVMAGIGLRIVLPLKLSFFTA